MKSITACPHCSTQFLVSDEQLSQYKGKVRCGNCLNVFNAVDYFVKSDAKDEPAASVEAPETPAVKKELNVAEAPEKPSATQVKSFVVPPPAPVPTPVPAPAVTPPSEVAAPAVDKAVVAEATKPAVEKSLEEKPETPVDAAPEKAPAPTQKAITDTPDTASVEEADTADDESVDQAFLDKTQSLIENINVDQFKVDIGPETNVDSVDEPSMPEVADKGPRFSIEPDTVLNANSGNVPASDEYRSEQGADKDDYADYELPPEPSFSNEEQLANAAEAATESNVDAADDFYLEEKKPTPLWLKLLVLLFIVVMLGQLIYFMRDNIAQMFPSTKPALNSICKQLGCEINLPKEIQLFSIDDSGIQEDAERQGVIRLTSTITNRADFNQAYPDLEVTLTDTKDKPQIRRVFQSTEYIPKNIKLADGIAPGESVSVDMPLMTDDVQVAGFRILLTYQKD